MSAEKQFVRKHVFINRRLQGRYMLTFLVPMMIMLAFMLFTLYLGAQTIVNTTTATLKQEIENKTSATLQDKFEPTAADYEVLVGEINRYVRNFSSNETFRKSLLTSLLWVFGTGTFLIILQVVLLTIFFSHKLAGPIYRLEKVCHGVIDGNYNQKVFLRKGDDMQNLASLFAEAVRLSGQRIQAASDEDHPERREEVLSRLRLPESEEKSA
jgi:beta-lactamase regulating signal transducer with metallopeptidase domain